MHAETEIETEKGTTLSELASALADDLAAVQQRFMRDLQERVQASQPLPAEVSALPAALLQSQLPLQLQLASSELTVHCTASNRQGAMVGLQVSPLNFAHSQAWQTEDSVAQSLSFTVVTTAPKDVSYVRRQ